MVDAACRLHRLPLQADAATAALPEPTLDKASSSVGGGGGAGVAVVVSAADADEAAEVERLRAGLRSLVHSAQLLDPKEAASVLRAALDALPD